MTTVDRATPEHLTELARGIVCVDYLVVDDNPAWRTSLLLLASVLTAPDNIGMILVPVTPHLRGYWINGTVPGVTLTCTLVAREDLDELRARVETMHAALHPDD